jgi:hypothetical protein
MRLGGRSLNWADSTNGRGNRYRIRNVLLKINIYLRRVMYGKNADFHIVNAEKFEFSSHLLR